MEDSVSNNLDSDTLERIAKLLGLDHKNAENLANLAEQIEDKIVDTQNKESKSNAKIRNLEKMLNETKNSLQKSEDNLFSLEERHEEFLGITKEPLILPDWATVPNGVNPNASGLPNIPILTISDVHYGEIVTPSQVNNTNCYNVKVLEKRMERLASGVIGNLRSHGGKKAPGIVLCFLGDYISGNLHEGIKTDKGNKITQAVGWAGVKCKFIETMHKEFKNVWVITVPGNHDRITEKQESKNILEESVVPYIMALTEKHFKGVKGIDFMTPESGEAYFSIYGRNFVGLHGHNMGTNGGQGFIGPIAPIARGGQKTIANYASEYKNVDTILMGHYHTFGATEYAIANASVVGHNEYAKNLKLRIQYPSQNLIIVHPRMGTITTNRIFVSGSQEMKEDSKIYYSTRTNEKPAKDKIPAWTTVEGAQKAARQAAENNRDSYRAKQETTAKIQKHRDEVRDSAAKPKTKKIYPKTGKGRD